MDYRARIRVPDLSDNGTIVGGPVFTDRTSVGFDVHARSVAAAAIDGDTGVLFQTKVTPDHQHVTSWLAGLPGPVAVSYEAGPTGFGLYRHLRDAGIRCAVLAPSKLQRPAGERVKTDAKDALHLAKLVRLDEITPVEVPSTDREATRDSGSAPARTTGRIWCSPGTG